MFLALRAAIAILCISCTFACSAPRSSPAPDDDVSLRFRSDSFARTAPVRGSLQTPKGGQFGTTSLQRPKLDEIGVHRGFEYGGGIDLNLGALGIYAEASRLELHGSAKLDTTLVSQALVFEEGTQVDSDSSLDLYGLGVSRRFELPVLGESTLGITPGLGARALGVRYRLEGDGVTADRRYTNIGPELRLDLDYRPAKLPSLRLELSGRRTVDELLGGRRLAISEVSFRVLQDVGSHASLFLEAGTRHMLLRDTQPDLQNRIHVDFGPWVGGGFEIRF